jgi:hypothetical protein
MRSMLAVARDDVLIEELLVAIEHTIDVERIAWRSSVSSVLGDRLLRPTYGDSIVRAGRVAARGVAHVLATGIAARAWVRGADRAPQLRQIADQVALFTSPDQVELATAIDAPSFYHASDDFTACAWSPARVIEAERRIVDRCGRVFAGSNALAETLKERHRLPQDRVVVVPDGMPAESRARTMLDAMREVA